MALCLNSPPVTAGNVNEQLMQLRSYVYQTVEVLNVGFQDMNAQGILQEINTAVSSNADKEENTSVKSIQNNIRTLIIKTADYAVKNSEELTKSLKSDYVAVSDFGKYTEQLQNDITANSEGIQQLFHFTSGISSEFGDGTVSSEQYIKTGLLFYDSEGAPVYGVGIGNLSTTVTQDGETILDKQNLLTTVAADEIAFWNSGAKIAYINGNMMYFPAGTLKADNADISGTLTATSGVIGGCSIENGVLKIANANITNIDASKITTGKMSVRNIVFDGIMDILGNDGGTTDPYEVKGRFGYELESLFNRYSGLLLESTEDSKCSLLIKPGQTWLADGSDGATKILRFRNGEMELTYDEDYDNGDDGCRSSLYMDGTRSELSVLDRDSLDKTAYIRIEEDDIKIRFNGMSYYMSEIVDACGL